MKDCEKQARDFMKNHGVKFSARLLGNDFYFPEDRKRRDIYSISLWRGSKKWTFRFGQSLHFSGGEGGTKPPSAYDVLACLTKYDEGSFEDFCSACGYDENSKTAKKIYPKVVKEYNHVVDMFEDCLDELREIN